MFVAEEKLKKGEKTFLAPPEMEVRIVVSPKGKRVLKGKRLSDVQVIKCLSKKIEHVLSKIRKLQSFHHDLLADIHESIGDSGAFGSNAKSFKKAIRHRKKAHRLDMEPHEKALDKAEKKFAAAVAKLLQYAKKKQPVPSSPAESAS